jgi:Protein of unknown function (DUF742)
MTATAEDVWYDIDAGPLVRLYMIASGRGGGSAGDFMLGAMVQSVPEVQPSGAVPVDGEGAGAGLSREQKAIVRLAEKPVPVSELAARLGLPLPAVRSILGELRDAGLVTVGQDGGGAGGPTAEQLQQLLSGLNAL